MIQTEEFLTVQEVADLLGIKPATVYHALGEARLSCVSKYGRKLIRREDALAYRLRTQPDGHILRHRPTAVRISPNAVRPERPRLTKAELTLNVGVA